MKLRSPWVGSAKGKLGDGVYYRRKGQQCARARAIEIANPKTLAQTVVRAAFTAATKLAASLKEDVVSHSFEGVEYGSKSQNYFVAGASKILRSKINEAVQAGSYFGYAPAVGRLAQFGNIAEGILISKGSLPSVDYMLRQDLSESAQNSTFCLISHSEAVDSLATATVADFEKLFGVPRDSQVTFVFFGRTVDNESVSQKSLNCAKPFVVRFNVKDDAAETDLLFSTVSGDDEGCYRLNSSVLDTQRSSANISNVVFYARTPKSFEVQLQETGDTAGLDFEDGDSGPKCLPFVVDTTVGVGFAMIVSRWVNGSWLRSTQSIAMNPNAFMDTDDPDANVLYVKNETTWNPWADVINSYTETKSATQNRYLNQEKN